MQFVGNWLGRGTANLIWAAYALAANNFWTSRSSNVRRLVHTGFSYGISSLSVDGNNQVLS